MKSNRDPIYICIGFALAFVWALLLNRVQPDYRIVYLFLLPIIAIPTFYLIFVRNRFPAASWARALLWLMVILLGVVSFFQAILRINLIEMLFDFYKN